MNKRLTKNIPQTIYGYQAGMKRILAKQIQQTLEREKQPNLAPAGAQPSSQ